MFIYFKGNSVHLDYSPLMINISLFTYKMWIYSKSIFHEFTFGKRNDGIRTKIGRRKEKYLSY